MQSTLLELFRNCFIQFLEKYAWLRVSEIIVDKLIKGEAFRS